jgi:CRISPR/Cas system endoribonuclease Cas6 (RAMP superfamily)
MKIAYDGGVGSKNSLGFGMVREWEKINIKKK